MGREVQPVTLTFNSHLDESPAAPFCAAASRKVAEAKTEYFPARAHFRTVFTDV